MPSADTQNSTRSRRSERSANRPSNTAAAQSTPPSYGYHNTFHTHATPLLDSPPSYAHANSASTLARAYTKHLEEAEALWNNTTPPPYQCTVRKEAILGMKHELTAVFQVSQARDWHDVYVVLHGTQLNIHRLKSPSLLSKSRCPTAGRLIRSFTLQHSEIGVASDFKKTPLTPKSPFAHLVPAAARHKLYETDPQLFEPVREHAIRLRLETEQFLLCAPSQDEMLDWVEMLCAAVDISQPLEGRSEPRYRSLPRRSRRQRVLEGARLGRNIENLSSLEAGRRIIAEQEAIVRQLYPHLADNPDPLDVQDSDLAAQPLDADGDEFDPDDVRFPSRRPRSASPSRGTSAQEEQTADEHERPTTSESYDPKDAPVTPPSRSQVLRYRRRCAPVLLACSPRVSDVVICGGRRVRINTKENILVEYTSHPPRYDAHNFPKVKRAPKQKQDAPVSSQPTVPKNAPAPILVQRPSSSLRAVSDDSITSFGYDLASTSSDSAPDDIRSAAPSEPPSPTQAKADATRLMAEAYIKAKKSARNGGDGSGEGGFTLGTSLLI